ncbi:MAG: SpoIIE family protein phosphatase [Victivallaceae bacterium]|nr:SpoIIE family protein phosphatase [Victivallaceae bacterium]
MAFKLSFYSAALLFMVFALTLAFAGPWAWRMLNERLEERSLAAVNNTAVQIDQLLARSEAVATTLAAALEAQPALSAAEVDALLRGACARAYAGDPRIIGIMIAFEPYTLHKDEKYSANLAFLKNGEITVRQIGSDRVDYFKRDWYMVPKERDTGIWVDPFPSEGGIGQRLISYSVPFFRAAAAGQRRFAGAVVVDLDIEQLRSLLDEMALDESSDGFGFLTTQFSQFVIHPDRELEDSRSLISLLDKHAGDLAAGQLMMKSADSGTVVLPQLEFFKGGTRIFHATTRRNGWKVCAAVPADWVAEQLWKYFAIGLAVYLAVTLLGIIGISLIVRRMTAPLTTLTKTAKLIGAGNFDTDIPAAGDGEIGELSGAFAAMQHELSNYIKRLSATVAARERIEGELNAARMIQNDILPRLQPPLPDCPAFSIAPALRPARAIGGDMYDIFFLDERRLFLMIGDVSGKGIAAAMFMAVAETLQRDLSSRSGRPDEIMTALNRMLAQHNNALMFITCFMGVLDTENGEFIYCNAGHNPPLCLRHNGECDALAKRHGPPLGVVETVKYGSSSIRIGNLDTLLLYTDGVTEAFSSTGMMYTFDKLRELGKKLAAENKSPAEMLSAILEDVDSFSANCEQSDDITLLILTYTMQPNTPPPPPPAAGE